MSQLPETPLTNRPKMHTGVPSSLTTAQRWVLRGTAVADAPCGLWFLEAVAGRTGTTPDEPIDATVEELISRGFLVDTAAGLRLASIALRDDVLRDTPPSVRQARREAAALVSLASEGNAPRATLTQAVQRVEAARGRLRLAVAGVLVRCETWVLRAVRGSRRSRVRREVVAAGASTGEARVWVPIGATTDSMLVSPAWAGHRETAEPAWLPAVRERVACHEDLLAALTIGDDRVVLLALDDPRPETTVARAHLVRDVAAMIR